MFRVDHSLDIYGPDYSQSESTSAHTIVALIPWKNENQTFDFIKPNPQTKVATTQLVTYITRNKIGNIRSS